MNVINKIKNSIVGKGIKNFDKSYGDQFDYTALFSSAVYFLILAILLIMINTNEVNTENSKQFSIALIATLILPIIFFSKLLYLSDNNSVDRYQKIVLLIFFAVVLIDSIFTIENIETYNKVLYTKMTILPILIFLTFGLGWYGWNKKGVPRTLFLLNILLGCIYVVFYVDAILQVEKTKGEIVTAVVSIETILSFLLMMVFLYMSYKTFEGKDKW